MKPIVSIALPVYNGAATLKLAVQSILQQSFENWELIILDDHSSDHSLAFMHSFDDSRIRLVEGDTNIGLSARLNMAVDMATGIYFARMDQDDVSFPDRIEKQFNYLQQHAEIDLLATASIAFRSEGEALGVLPVFGEHEQICAKPWNGFHFPHPTWMGRTDWFRQHRYDSSADGAEDQHLLLRTYRESRFACLQEPVLAYREGDRPLKKLFRTRRIFTYTYVRQFMLEKRYGMAIKVLILSSLKIVADVLNFMFGVACMRSHLRALSRQENAAWQAVWQTCDAGKDNKRV